MKLLIASFRIAEGKKEWEEEWKVGKKKDTTTSNMGNGQINNAHKYYVQLLKRDS